MTHSKVRCVCMCGSGIEERIQLAVRNVWKDVVVVCGDFGFFPLKEIVIDSVGLCVQKVRSYDFVADGDLSGKKWNGETKV